MCEVHAALKALLNGIGLFRGAGILGIGEHGSDDLRLQSSHGFLNDSTAAGDDSDNHTNVCGTSGMGVYTPHMKDASTTLHTPLALDGVDSNGTCKIVLGGECCTSRERASKAKQSKENGHKG
jgi:hypothetical protein